MTELTEGQIRTRACELWKAAGEPEGMIEVFWYQSEKELLLRRNSNPDENFASDET